MNHEDGLYSCDEYYNHLVVAEELKQRMVEILKKDPASPIKAVKLAAAVDFGNDQDLFKEIIDTLVSYHAIEHKLLCVRSSIIGSMPRSSDSFDPKYLFADNIRAGK